MSRFDTYFFDFDGTLGDTETDIRNSWLAAIAELKLPKNDFDSKFRVGPPLPDTAAVLYPDISAESRELLQEKYKHFYDDATSYTALPYPGITAMLQKLVSEKKKIYIVTNKRYKPLWKLMKKFDFLHFCHGMFVPDIISKDNQLKKSELLAMALKVSGATVEKSVMIGDTVLDIYAGKKNDIATCGVTWGYAPVSELQEAGPDFIISSPADLPQL